MRIKKNPKVKKERRLKRHRRIRAKIFGTEKIPRLVVFRSHKHIYAQLIDDKKAETLVSASSLEIKKKGTKSEIAYLVGELIAEKAKKLGIKRVVFDRGGFKYHGRIKKLAEGARQRGLIF